MKKVMFFVLVVLVVQGNAQVNLVPNPSFEIYDTCPWNTGQINLVQPWFSPSQGTPDYLNNCVTYLGVPDNLWGHQLAHSGIGYGGLLASLSDTSGGLYNYREYIEASLDSYLVSGVTYYVTLYLSLADSMNFATDAFAVNFSNDTIKNDSIYGYMLYATPQVVNPLGNYFSDKINWIKLSGSFVAQGGERFITVGNFRNDLNTDTILVPGGASPPLSDWSGGYYYIDDVCVSRDSVFAANWTNIESNDLYNFRIYPNPASTKITLDGILDRSTFSLVDCYGHELIKGICGERTTEIDVAMLPEGIYFLLINNVRSYKILINH